MIGDEFISRILVIASEAIHSSASEEVDRFAAEHVIGPRFARTRWLLAMTSRIGWI
jgi:hypothetical protein